MQKKEWKDIRKLLGKAVLFLCLNALLGYSVLCLFEQRLHYAPWETDSVLLVMPQNQQYGSVFLGTSHAYICSRFSEHHQLTEEILGQRLLNLAQPTGGGLMPARFFLEYFLEEGNQTDSVVYFLDPFVFFCVGSNEYHKFVYNEPFRFRFLWKLLRNHYGIRRVITYIRSKFGRDWLLQRSEPLIAHPYALQPSEIDPERIKKRIGTLYPDGLQEENFQKYAQEFLKIARLCREHGIPLHVITPPTLLGPEPGAARVNAWLREQQKTEAFSFHDFVNAMPQARFFYNLDHLNTAGIAHFMQYYVRPILDPTATPSHP